MNGISKSASCDNITDQNRGSKKGRKSRDAGKNPDAEIPSNASDDDPNEGFRRDSDAQDDVFVVELEKGDSGIGVGLIDGLVRIKLKFHPPSESMAGKKFISWFV